MPQIELPALPNELSLVMACARWPLKEQDTVEIRRRVVTGLDWDRVLAWARRHEITPLIYANLRRTCATIAPRTVMEQFSEDARHTARGALAQIAETKRIAALLSENGIRSLTLKGPALALLAFGDPVLRASWDIDILIDPASIAQADRLMVAAGYRRMTPDFELTPRQYKVYLRRRCQFVYLCERLGIVLELHWRLSSNSALLPLDEAALWGRSERIRLSETTITTLPDMELFLYLCAHGSVHMWFRLKWLADIAALLRRMSPDTIDRMADRARALDVTRPFHVALILSHDLLGAPVPPHTLSRALGDTVAQRLANAARRALSWGGTPTEPADSPWFNLWVSWHAFWFKTGFRYSWTELRDQAVSPEDWARIPLPDSLFFLYLPLRPVSWVLRKVPRLLQC